MRLTGSTFIWGVVLLLAACGKNRIPSDVLPREKMQSVMWDMLEADEFIKEFALKRDSTAKDSTATIHALYDKVFALNKTTQQEFSRSFEFYRTHPVIFKEIIDSLNAKAQRGYVDPNVSDTANNTGNPAVTQDPPSRIPKKLDTNAIRNLKKNIVPVQ